MPPTQIPSITAAQFAARMAALIPNGWASAAAKQNGGVVYALLETAGTQTSFLLKSLTYALGSTRIQTAVNGELDLAGEDFFGDQLLRNQNETDDSYRARLLANLPPQGATRPAIVNALEALTGVLPRVIEPWQVNDTGAWDVGLSYWDIDSTQNPARWGDATCRYQGFIITPAPQIAGLDGNPLETWDDSAYWDIPGYGLLQLAANPVQQIYTLLARLHVEGTIIWVHIGPTTTITPAP